ncbi:hypothetical protein AAHA92_20507 [Salvia divinorum]|uniref:GRF-type domain-containing protein n=1 Tax=Salvia divinorum TaxID=28513 RepID=A0ABD1GIH6_SALDI
MAGDIPECGCGEGKMELRCAGKTAMHAGRYYLKCPHNGKHLGSFQWYDEYQRQVITRWSYVGQCHRSKSAIEHGCGQCHGSKSCNEIKVHLVIGLMRLVVFLFGVSIDKLL